MSALPSPTASNAEAAAPEAAPPDHAAPDRPAPEAVTPDDPVPEATGPEAEAAAPDNPAPKDKALNDTSPEPHLPITYWLMTGGRGAPPTETAYLRMARERKAAYREEVAYEAARKAAQAEFKEQWAPTGLAAVFGIKKRKKPGRQELMRLFGPTSTVRGPKGVGNAGPEENAEGKRKIPDKH